MSDRVRIDELAREQVEKLREELERGPTGRWNPEEGDVQRAVLKLVLSLVELIRRLLERQAIRRMENGTLSDDEIERLGRALMQLEEAILQLADQFGIPPEELELDLGPLGKLF